MRIRRAPRPAGSNQGRYLLASAIVLAFAVAPFAMAAGEGNPVRIGVRNPGGNGSVSAAAETQIIATLLHDGPHRRAALAGQAEQLLDRVRQSVRVRRGHEASPLGRDRLGEPCDVGPHDHQLHCHGLLDDDRHGVAVAVRGDHARGCEQVGVLEQRADLARRTCSGQLHDPVDAHRAQPSDAGLLAE